MTSYSSMAARGREEARARTAGRRKPVVARLDYSKTPDPDMPPGFYDIIDAALIGKCGHVLERKRWRAFAGPDDWKLTAMRRKVGRRMTCQHDDCRIADPELDRSCPTCSAPAGEDCRGFGYCPARSAAVTTANLPNRQAED